MCLELHTLASSITEVLMVWLGNSMLPNELAARRTFGNRNFAFLLIQQENMWNMFKVNSKDTKTTSLT